MCSSRPMVRTSALRLRYENAEVRATTRSVGTCASQFEVSSVRPSQNICSRVAAGEVDERQHHDGRRAAAACRAAQICHTAASTAQRRGRRQRDPAPAAWRCRRRAAAPASPRGPRATAARRGGRSSRETRRGSRYRRHQPIALARHGLDVARRIVVVAEHLAQLRHRLVDRRGADDHAAPHRFEQFVLAHHRARRLRQAHEQPHGARLESSRVSVPRVERIVARIGEPVADLHWFVERAASGRARGAPHGRENSRHAA